MTKLTLDTSTLDDDKVNMLLGLVNNKDFDLVTTTVTAREIKGTNIKPLNKYILETAVWDESDGDNSIWADGIMETFVLDESQLGKARFGSSQSKDTFEEILRIISDASFPKVGSRDNLTTGEKHQLRDAMILEAHVREKRDIFISDDRKAYISKNNTKREKLEKLCNTKILTFEEFIEWLIQNK